MSTTPFQTGGGGTNFEQSVQAGFLLSLILKLPLPILSEAEVTGMAFQASSKGYKTDDLLLEANQNASNVRMLMQVKHQIAFTLKNETFKEVVTAFWSDFNNNDLFAKDKDKLVVVTGNVAINVRAHLVTVLNYARTSATADDFYFRSNAVQTKKEQLDLFRELLKQANNDLPVSDDVLWSFLRCVHILEFDFSNDSSADETHFLQLIKITKSHSCNKPETDIWNNIVKVATHYNSTGGHITQTNLKDALDVSCFEIKFVNAFAKDLSKLMRDSSLVMEPIQDNIQGLRFEMSAEKEAFINSIFTNQITIVTGIPGAGKSALVKTIIREGIYTGYIIFKADQLQKSTLASVLASQGINSAVHDIMDCLSLFSSPVIFIESAEKLLEGDFGNAFTQLVSLLEKNPDIRLVLSARSYAVDLIIQRYGLPQEKINTISVAPLGDSDLEKAIQQFPVLGSILNYVQIKELLRSPKYLALALITVQRDTSVESNITMAVFKSKLWSAVIEDSTHRGSGLPVKRQKAFYSIALKRARAMSLFVEPDDTLDWEAIDALENDEVLYQQGNNHQYAPAHDIFEDWALVRYVSSVFEKNPKSIDFFQGLGHEPAIRRAFRLWVSDQLQANSNDIASLLRGTINEPDVERYWADELLIAVFRSDEAAYFFLNFKDDLLADNCTLLARCIHLLRTCCREMIKSDISISKEPIPMPIGSGWPQCLYFISQNAESVEEVRIIILNFLIDWEYRFLFTEKPLDISEIEAFKSLILRYIGQVENGDKFWTTRERESYQQILVTSLFRICGFAREETEALIRRSMKKGDDEGWRVGRWGQVYNIVLRNILGGVNSRNICFLFPDIVIEICKKAWRYRKPPLPKDADEFTRMMHQSRGHSLDMDERWGIKDKHLFFPPGIYKTPVYNLFLAYPEKTLSFVIDFVNTSVQNYATGDYDYKHHLEKVSILGLRKGARKIWGAKELWMMYRGMSVTSYLLESLMKSLEKYLLELCERNRPRDRERVKAFFDFIYANANSVAPIGVLSSVAMAYPNVVGESMPSLFSIPEAYSWDFQRRMEESGAMTIYDSELPWYVHEEKVASKALPHRTRGNRGMSDFVIDLQFNNKSINDELFKLFDRMKKLKSIKSSIVYKKILTEIDARKWKPQEYSEESGGFPIKPEYAEDVKEMMDEGKDLVVQQNKASHCRRLVEELYKSSDTDRLDDWKIAYEYFEQSENQDFNFDRMVLFAVVGLRDFRHRLSDDERNMCAGLLLMLLRNFTKEVYHFQLEPDEESYNPMWEIKELLQSIHILVDVFEGTEAAKELSVICVYLLKVPFDDYRLKEFAGYFRKEVMSSHPQFGKKIWECMVELAEWQKTNEVKHGPKQNEEYHQFQVNEQNFIYGYFNGENQSYLQKEVSFLSHDATTSVLALQIIPFKSNDIDFAHYVPMIVKEMLKDTEKESDNDNDWSISGKKVRKIPNKLLFPLEQWIAGFILSGTKDSATELFTMMIDAIHKSEHLLDKYGGPGLYAFVQVILDGIMDQLDLLTEASVDEDAKSKLVDEFWVIWNALALIIQKKSESTQRYYFNNTALLDPSNKWSSDRRSFPALVNHSSQYETLARKFGTHNPAALLRTLSTIGAESLLPHGLEWLKTAVGDDVKKKAEMGYADAERLADLLYKYHILNIKAQPSRLQEFLWLLDVMIDKGSSKAYLIRENVITYKSVIR